jgi:hypothetical protein
MTARDTFNSSIATAETTKTVTLDAAQTTFQETINAKGCNVGYTVSGDNYTNFATAVANANAALRSAMPLSERSRHQSKRLARPFAAPAISDPSDSKLALAVLVLQPAQPWR